MKRPSYISTLLFAIFSLAASILVFTHSLHMRDDTIVAVYFYVWYGGGLGGRHWNDTVYTPVLDEPLIGYYSSLDLDTIEWQLRLISEAGIDVLFISWWGPGSFEDRAAKLVFEKLREFGLKAAILVEPYLGNDPNLYSCGWWGQVLDYVHRNYVVPYRDVYFHLEGRPLVLAFNPIGLACRPSDPRFTIRIVGNGIDNAGYQDWDLWPDYLAPWTTHKSIELRIRRDGYVAITPRFDDKIFCKLGVRMGCEQRLLDPDYTVQAYVKQWEWVLKNRDKVKLVAIYSWNEYHERSMIEPHYDATSKNKAYNPYMITKTYIEKLKQ